MLNTEFGTHPLVIHVHGHHDDKPAWPPIRDWYDAQPPRSLPPLERVTLITCNNGHPAMGLFEESCAKLGLQALVVGQGAEPWVNARDKPRFILEALGEVRTPYTLYADSRDCLLLDDPEILVDLMEDAFGDSGLVFGGDRMNWPPIAAFKRFEDKLAAGAKGDFHYLNGGAWIGRTDVARRFFAEAASTPPHPADPTSEQGILKALLPRWSHLVAIDYACRMFQNLGFARASSVVPTTRMPGAPEAI